MSLSKKHYQAIAQIVKNNTVEPDITFPKVIVAATLTDHLSDYFKSDNPNFDPDRFKAACKGEDTRDLSDF